MLSCKSWQRKSSDKRFNRGVVFVELLIGLPVVLAIIFILTGIGSLINIRETLSSAVGNGIRLARTRGDAVRMRGPVAFQSLGGALNCATQEDQLSHNIPAGSPTAFSTMADWNARIFSDLPAASSCQEFANFFPYYYYLALGYTYEAMRLSVPDVRYPCSPPSETSPAVGEAAPELRRGCLRCVFLNPTDTPETQPSQYLNPGLSLLNEPRFGIKCDYAPNDISVHAALSLLSLVQGGGSNEQPSQGVVSVTAYSGVP